MPISHIDQQHPFIYCTLKNQPTHLQLVESTTISHLLIFKNSQNRKHQKKQDSRRLEKILLQPNP